MTELYNPKNKPAAVTRLKSYQRGPRAAQAPLPQNDYLPKTEKQPDFDPLDKSKYNVEFVQPFTLRVGRKYLIHVSPRDITCFKTLQKQEKHFTTPNLIVNSVCKKLLFDRGIAGHILR